MRLRSVILSVFLASCSGAQPNNVPEEPTPLLPKVDSPPLDPARPPRGTIWREDVDATVRAGLGRFLQRVAVEPRLEQGKFQGWTIVELRPPHFWSDVDLRPGDVVTRVNDLPIERDTEAFAAFESLKNAEVLRVAYSRQGAPRKLEFQIVSRGEKPSVAPSAPNVPKAATPPPAPSARTDKL